MIASIPDGICCVCGHKLSDHVDEGDIWRCHSLGQDLYQCECVLRKDRAAFIIEAANAISYYDLKRRINEQLRDEFHIGVGSVQIKRKDKLLEDKS